MATTEVEIVIERPVEEVFSFLTNYKSYLQWDTGIEDICLEPVGPVQVGTQLTEVRTFMGRRVETVSEIILFEEDKRLSRQGIQPPGIGEMLFEPYGSGTMLTYKLAVQMEGLYSIAAPVLAGGIKKGLESNLKNFKVQLERGTLVRSS